MFDPSPSSPFARENYPISPFMNSLCAVIPDVCFSRYSHSLFLSCSYMYLPKQFLFFQDDLQKSQPYLNIYAHTYNQHSARTNLQWPFISIFTMLVLWAATIATIATYMFQHLIIYVIMIIYYKPWIKNTNVEKNRALEQKQQ